MLFNNRYILIILLGLCICIVGCGGGGSGSSSTSTPSSNSGNGTNSGGTSNPSPAAITSGLSVETPTLTGKVGQEVSLQIVSHITDRVGNMSVDITLDNDSLGKTASAEANPVQEISGLPDTSAAVYQWIGPRTIRVLFASSTGVGNGETIVGVPVKVNSETAAIATASNIKVYP